MIDYQIPGTWETIDSFDFSNIINQQDQDAAMADVRQLISEDKFFKNSPRFQTNVNVFGLPGEHWLKFKFSFLMSCFMYLKQEVKIEQVQSWCFMTSNHTVEDRDQLWHTHQYGSERTLSGIYYLHIPSDADPATSGTEFAPNGLENLDRWSNSVKNFNWIIYPGKTWHRPCPPQSSQDRFIIAADMVF
jgi:hypothetical protein